MSTTAATVGVLDAHADEAVDREEAADVAGRIAPPLQAVVLAGERLGRRQRLGARRQREALRAEAQLVADDLEPPDHVVQRLTEHRQDDLAVGGGPVDVEPPRRLAVGAVAQHRPPARVELGLGDGDVVGHVVDQRAHAPAGEVVEQRGQPVEPAELVAHPGVVDDVVAVGAAGHRLGHRRQVHVADPEPGEPWQLGGDAANPNVGVSWKR